MLCIHSFYPVATHLVRHCRTPDVLSKLNSAQWQRIRIRVCPVGTANSTLLLLL